MRHASNASSMLVVALVVTSIGCGGGERAPSTEPSTRPSGVIRPDAAETVPASEAEPVAKGWGTLSGRFVYQGTAPKPPAVDTSKEAYCVPLGVIEESLLVADDGGLANVLIYVRSRDLEIHPDFESTAADSIVIDNNKCRFAPHVLTIRLGQNLLIKNSDPVSHNTNLAPPGDQAINPLLPPEATQSYSFQREQSIPVPVSCNIHPWMKGWILPRSNPYLVATGADGRFELQNLPSGRLEFQVWHERSGYLEAKSDWSRGRFEMTIQPGEHDLGTVEVAAALFEK